MLNNHTRFQTTDRTQLEEITREISKKISTKAKKNAKKTGILMSLLPLAACGGAGTGGGTGGVTLNSGSTLALDGFTEIGTNTYQADDDSGGTFLAQSTSNALTVSGGGGADTITTSNGDDMIRGGNGADNINAGAGDDAIVIIGTTTANQYTQSSITNSAGSGTDLSSLITLADLNGRTVSEVQSGEVIDGGAGNNTLFIYGTVDLTGVTLNNIEVLVVNSNVTLTEEQLRQFTTIDGDGESILNIVVPEGAESVTLDLTQYEIHDVGTLNIEGDITIIIDDISDIAEIEQITVEDLSQITLSIQSDSTGVTNINLGQLAETFEKIDIIETGVDVTIEVDDDDDIDDLELDGIEGYGDIDDKREGDDHEHNLDDLDDTKEYNYAPELEPDLEDTHEGQEIWIDVLDNDEDESDLTLSSIELVGSKGTAHIVENGILFDPGDDFDYLNNGQTAEVKIWYVATDGEKESQSYVRVIVGGESETPDTPFLEKVKFSVVTGETIFLEDDHFWIEHAPENSRDITFRVNEVGGGTFNHDGVVVDEFTLDNVENGFIYFIHDGSDNNPEYNITMYYTNSAGEAVEANIYQGHGYSGDFIFDGENNLVTSGTADRTLDKSEHDGDYTVTGGDGQDTITMGAGNDTVDGGLGNDHIQTGAGHDRIIYGDGDTIDGGTGFDTLVIEEEHFQLDLSTLDAMNIEMIDLGVESDIAFSVQDIVNLTPENKMFVIWGDGNDGVTFTDDGWDHIGQDEWEGQMMDVYQANDHTLLIDADISQPTF
ncbi:hypothetical protein [Pseudemcibacter aquimaris]|uniref:hypothetical protein n=1 Tax=Pseudemcibacter aquimaris TaxID=2857064 RepID=UPI002010C9B3|nr:hypothetical protein [Pseudemcibacter aquimaris]MCC3861136.1 hypothetical protein [Pseudemcibacter aquimaris]WDU59953.1 hypothetical protein KW060_06750 [Pseudemcibacter aquimaris]